MIRARQGLSRPRTSTPASHRSTSPAQRGLDHENAPTRRIGSGPRQPGARTTPTTVRAPLQREILNIRLVTLACAGVMLLSPNGYDRINVAGLIGMCWHIGERRETNDRTSRPYRPVPLFPREQPGTGEFLPPQWLPPPRGPSCNPGPAGPMGSPA